MTDNRPRISDKKRRELFLLHGGICHLCGLKIDGTRQRWEVEHVIPRSMIGRLADTDENMKPAHVDCHKEKTAEDKANLARAVRRQDRHTGVHRPKAPLPFGRNSKLKRRMNGEIVDRRTGQIIRGAR